MTPTPKALNDTLAKLHTLLLEVRGTPTSARVDLYAGRFCGGLTLMTYLQGSAPLRERMTLATALVEILLSRDYSRLPELPAIENVKVLSDGRSPGDDEDEPETELSAEVRELVRREVRKELSAMYATLSRVLGEP